MKKGSDKKMGLPPVLSRKKPGKKLTAKYAKYTKKRKKEPDQESTKKFSMNSR
jgi:hypothetical protein